MFVPASTSPTKRKFFRPRATLLSAASEALLSRACPQSRRRELTSDLDPDPRCGCIAISSPTQSGLASRLCSRPNEVVEVGPSSCRIAASWTQSCSSPRLGFRGAIFPSASDRGRRCTRGSLGGTSRRCSTASSMIFPMTPMTSRASLTPPTPKRTSTLLAERGDPKSVYWTLSRRPHHQDPRSR